MKKSNPWFNHFSILLTSVLLLPACDTEYDDDFESNRFEDVEFDEEADVDPSSSPRSDIDAFVSDQEASGGACGALSGCIATAKSEGHPWLYDDCIDALGDACVAEMQ